MIANLPTVSRTNLSHACLPLTRTTDRASRVFRVVLKQKINLYFFLLFSFSFVLILISRPLI